MSRIYTLPFTAGPEHIDELGHVNNAVWVQWMERLSVSHWQAHAPPEYLTSSVWMVTRHEIDYRGNMQVGASCTGTTWIDTQPTGARFNRNIAFQDKTGKLLVRAVSTWAMMDAETQRLMRVPADLAAHFLTDAPPEGLK